MWVGVGVEGGGGEVSVELVRGLRGEGGGGNWKDGEV